ncbi:MAG: phosphotransferase [Lachnospiraceae bacterium]|nr:phosphotransferase [Lachnospiraceae bacterium]
MKKNAIILAAGKSSRFAPFTYEKPKGLFRVKGEILIERQIEQLQSAGIEDIYCIVGYMKEKFFYLEQKYGVKLIVNNEFGKKGNLYSLYKAKDYLVNTYICCADHYFLQNPFVNDENPGNISYRACIYYTEKFREFAVECSDADVITSFAVGGANSLAMVGHAYVNEKFSAEFRTFMEKEMDDFGVAAMFWEEFYAKHQTRLTFYKKEFAPGEILEFENIEDLRAFDSEFLVNVDSEIIVNICNTLSCEPNDVTNIEVINAGLTNVSFAFDVNGIKYVYRHPGGTAGNLINRQAELFAQEAAHDIGIDKSFICMELEGWKISYFVKEAKNCDFENGLKGLLDADTQLKIAMEYLHRLHKVEVTEKAMVKVFDNLAEGKKLMEIASNTKGHLFKEFADIISKVERLYEFVKADAKRLGFGLVLCHNDTYEPNYLIDNVKEIYLIDWEYAGMNYAANDIGSILCRYDWTDKQTERYLKAYAGHELNADERRFYYGFIPISAFYWFCWGLYKGSVGDDDSFFFLPAYRNLIRYIDMALESYEK